MIFMIGIEKKIKEDDGGIFEGVTLMLAMAVSFIILLIIMSDIEESSSQKENEYISEFYEGRIVENITRNEIEGVNWNKKVEFANGEPAYVQISCEINSQEEIESSKEKSEKYKCQLTEIIEK